MEKRKKRSKKSVSARDRILEAAKNKFAVAGFEGVSTRQIAEEAGVAQSLLLYHFESKEALWQDVMNMLFEQSAYIFSQKKQTPDAPPEEQLLAQVEAFVTFCAHDADLHRLMTIEGKARSGRLKWLIKKHLKSRHDASCALIKKAQANGIVRAGDPTILYYTAIAIAGSLYTFEPEIRLISPSSPSLDVETVMSLIRGALMNEGN